MADSDTALWALLCADAAHAWQLAGVTVAGVAAALAHAGARPADLAHVAPGLVQAACRGEPYAVGGLVLALACAGCVEL